MKKQTSTDLRRALREQRAAYEELLGLSGAILAALCVRCGDGATLRLPKQAVHDALETYEFAAAADGEDYVLSYRERATCSTSRTRRSASSSSWRPWWPTHP